MSTPSLFTRYGKVRGGEGQGDWTFDRFRCIFIIFRLSFIFLLLTFFTGNWGRRPHNWDNLSGGKININFQTRNKRGGSAGEGDDIHMTIQRLWVEFLQGKYVNCLVIKMSRAPGRICKYKFYETFPNRAKELKQRDNEKSTTTKTTTTAGEKKRKINK